MNLNIIPPSNPPENEPIKIDHHFFFSDLCNDIYWDNGGVTLKEVSADVTQCCPCCGKPIVHYPHNAHWLSKKTDESLKEGFGVFSYIDDDPDFAPEGDYEFEECAFERLNMNTAMFSGSCPFCDSGLGALQVFCFKHDPHQAACANESVQPRTLSAIGYGYDHMVRSIEDHKLFVVYLWDYPIGVMSYGKNILFRADAFCNGPSTDFLADCCAFTLDCIDLDGELDLNLEDVDLASKTLYWVAQEYMKFVDNEPALTEKDIHISFNTSNNPFAYMRVFGFWGNNYKDADLFIENIRKAAIAAGKQDLLSGCVLDLLYIVTLSLMHVAPPHRRSIKSMVIFLREFFAAGNFANFESRIKPFRFVKDRFKTFKRNLSVLNVSISSVVSNCISLLTQLDPRQFLHEIKKSNKPLQATVSYRNFKYNVWLFPEMSMEYSLYTSHRFAYNPDRFIIMASAEDLTLAEWETTIRRWFCHMDPGAFAHMEAIYFYEGPPIFNVFEYEPIPHEDFIPISPDDCEDPDEDQLYPYGQLEMLY